MGSKDLGPATVSTEFEDLEGYDATTTKQTEAHSSALLAIPSLGHILTPAIHNGNPGMLVVKEGINLCRLRRFFDAICLGNETYVDETRVPSATLADLWHGLVADEPTSQILLGSEASLHSPTPKALHADFATFLSRRASDHLITWDHFVAFFRPDAAGGDGRSASEAGVDLSSLRDRYKRVTKEEMNDMWAVFNMFDLDNSGELDLAELRLAQQEMDGGAVVDEQTLRAVLQSMDADNSNSVDFEEFLQFRLKTVPAGANLGEEEGTIVSHSHRLFGAVRNFRRNIDVTSM